MKRKGIFRVTPNKGEPYYITGKFEPGFFGRGGKWWFYTDSNSYVGQTTNPAHEDVKKFSWIESARDSLGFYLKFELAEERIE